MSGEGVMASPCRMRPVIPSLRSDDAGDHPRETLFDEIMARIDADDFPPELPQEQLQQLVTEGQIVAVTTFEDHMRPDVRWIAPAEYRLAFEELTEMSEAAYTKPGTHVPGFINIQKDADGDIVVLVRGDPIDGKMGPQARVAIPIDDWHQLIAQVGMLRPQRELQTADEAEAAPLTTGAHAGETMEEAVAADADDATDTAGAVAGDPLAQRTGDAADT